MRAPAFIIGLNSFMCHIPHILVESVNIIVRLFVPELDSNDDSAPIGQVHNVHVINSGVGTALRSNISLLTGEVVQTKFVPRIVVVAGNHRSTTANCRQKLIEAPNVVSSYIC